jgi:hypothetical protein
MSVAQEVKQMSDALAALEVDAVKADASNRTAARRVRVGLQAVKTQIMSLRKTIAASMAAVKAAKQ